MKKALQIVFGIITFIGVVMLVLVYFVGKEPEEVVPPKKDWGVGKNPFPPGDPRYANFEKSRAKRRKEAQEIFEDLNEKDDAEKIKNVENEDRAVEPTS